MLQSVGCARARVGSLDPVVITMGGARVILGSMDGARVILGYCSDLR